MGILARSALSISAAAAFLAGCGGSQPPIAAPGSMPQTSPAATHANRGNSWMLPEAASDDLLYVSNVQNVTVYSYPKGRHVGTLRGFYRPLGECTDSASDVFIANQNTVVEYKHGGTRPIRTLTLSGYAPVSCASDPTTGDLAVTWDAGFSSGYIAVYQHGSGTPALYNNGDMLFRFCDYDGTGNLFVDGGTKHGDLFEFAELPRNGNALINMSLSQNIGFGAAVQWDGRYVTVEDDDVNRIYRFTISGSNGVLKGTVDLGNAQGLYQTWIDGKKVVGADILSNTVWYWKYPAGGSAIKSITRDILAPVWRDDQQSSELMRIQSFGHVLKLAAAATMLAGCGGSQPPIGAPGATPMLQRSSASTQPGQQIIRGLAPLTSATKGLYVSEFYGSAILGYPPNNRRNKPPSCTVPGVSYVNDVAVDGNGNLIDPDGGSRTVKVFKGPGMCGKELGSIGDPYGQPSDATSADAATGTIVVGNQYDGPSTTIAPGSITLCTLKAGCTKNLTTREIMAVAGVAQARNGDCWASATNSGGTATLIYFKGCSGAGRAASHFKNKSYGGLDIDSHGNLVAISSFSEELYVYAGCNPSCRLVGGPFCDANLSILRPPRSNKLSTRLAVVNDTAVKRSGRHLCL